MKSEFPSRKIQKAAIITNLPNSIEMTTIRMQIGDYRNSNCYSLEMVSACSTKLQKSSAGFTLCFPSIS
jgi:hypothetical protein